MEAQPIVIAPLLENYHIEGGLEIKKETEEESDGIYTDDELEEDNKRHIIKHEIDFKDDPEGMSMCTESDTDDDNKDNIRLKDEKGVKEEK